MFGLGHVVNYRELWTDRVMTALPMRVVADTRDALVLYLAPETAFQAARSPDGGPVRDLDVWVSVPQTWTGGSLVRIVPRQACYAVDLEYDAERAFTGYYVNFEEPLLSTPQGFDTVDLVLDIEVDPHGEWRMKDEDDFAGGREMLLTARLISPLVQAAPPTDRLDRNSVEARVVQIWHASLRRGEGAVDDRGGTYVGHCPRVAVTTDILCRVWDSNPHALSDNGV